MQSSKRLSLSMVIAALQMQMGAGRGAPMVPAVKLRSVDEPDLIRPSRYGRKDRNSGGNRVSQAKLRKYARQARK